MVSLFLCSVTVIGFYLTGLGMLLLGLRSCLRLVGWLRPLTRRRIRRRLLLKICDSEVGCIWRFGMFYFWI